MGAAAIVVLLLVPATLCLAAEANDQTWQLPEVMAAKVRAESKQTVTGSDEPGATSKAKPKGRSRVPTPQWVWGSEGESSPVLRKRFFVAGKLDTNTVQAALVAACDGRMSIVVNGKMVGESDSWQAPLRADVGKFLKRGFNDIVVQASNDEGPAGFVFKLALTTPGKKTQHIVSDRSWQVAADADQQKWEGVRVVGPLGVKPWGNVFRKRPSATGDEANADVFELPSGFQVERLFSQPSSKKHGTWKSIAFDKAGRLLAIDNESGELYRLNIAPVGSKGRPTTSEVIQLKITQGDDKGKALSSVVDMLDTDHGLYLAVDGERGAGLYRARDTDQDGLYEEVVRLKAFQSGDAGGIRALQRSLSGDGLYVIGAAGSTPQTGFDSSRLPERASDDLLLSRSWSVGKSAGEAASAKIRGGWVAKIDFHGQRWQVVGAGFSDPQSLAFNADGQLFVLDNGAEADQGLPWFRPTQVFHVTSGADFGWRSASQNMPGYYLDRLPGMAGKNTGASTAVLFGYGAKFPAKYQRAMFVCDRSKGTIEALKVEPDGTSYKTVVNVFLSYPALKVADAEVGPDGALYLLLEGRRLTSGVYRVTYVGKKSVKAVEARNVIFFDLRDLRAGLEIGHGSFDDAFRTGVEHAVVELAVKNLGHADRHIRYAARLGLEHYQRTASRAQATAAATKSLSAENPDAILNAVVASSRFAANDREKLLATLDRLDFDKLSKRQQLDLLRAYALVFVRQGKPSPQQAAPLIAEFDRLYPAASDDVNRELSRLLVYLESSSVIAKTMSLLERSPERGSASSNASPNEDADSRETAQRIHYADMLSFVRNGWTMTERQRYFSWLNKAIADSETEPRRSALANIRTAAIATLSAEEQKALATVIAGPISRDSLPKPMGPGQEWTREQLLSLTEAGLSGRDFENGRRAFSAARCVVCHRFNGEGGAVGPELTAAIARFALKDVVEAIVEPSKVVPDKYRSSHVETIDGQVITGRVLRNAAGDLTVFTDLEDPSKVVRVSHDEIDLVTPSTISLMPEGLLRPLNEDEVLDLLAYLMSRGNPSDPVFQD